jgi:hypothetical protein
MRLKCVGKDTSSVYLNNNGQQKKWRQAMYVNFFPTE